MSHDITTECSLDLRQQIVELTLACGDKRYSHEKYKLTMSPRGKQI